jgi:hypothetical protein
MRPFRLVAAFACWRASVLVAAIAISTPGSARWVGPTDPILHDWFEKLASGKGLCCSFADGVVIEDVDWGTEAIRGVEGKTSIVYWVLVDGQRLVVPPEAVVTEPNRYGPAVVWPYRDSNGRLTVRCFMPGIEG